jgi:hypothetical protein
MPLIFFGDGKSVNKLLHLCSTNHPVSHIMRAIYLFLCCFIGFNLSAQVEQEQPEVEKDSLAPVADPYYREDQMYATIAYDLMMGKPDGYKQNSFSTALTVGFLRDMPVNKARTYAIAAGLGYAYHNIKHNLWAYNYEGETHNTYEILPEDAIKKNKLVLHALELPVELRWRNSDAVSHKFWRVYLGLKVSYIFADKAQYTPNEGSKITLKNDKNLNQWVYGAYVSAGWNTWNFYAYYGFTPLYKSAVLDSGEKLKLNTLSVGLAFYIL